MKPSGRNQGGYFGDTICIESLLQSIQDSVTGTAWQCDYLDAEPDCRLPVVCKPGSQTGPRIYVSTGIHGDEPAGPLAAKRLLTGAPWPDGATVWMCPCLNPTGFARNQRENRHGADLNRDYRHLRHAEVKAHVAWLSRLPSFDLALLMHEDWEADGFYVYELCDQNRTPRAEAIVASVARVCAIASSGLIDGHPSQHGVVLPDYDPQSRPEWPEAFYLREHKTGHLFNFESPSDYPMETRTDALFTAVCSALYQLFGSN